MSFLGWWSACFHRVSGSRSPLDRFRNEGLRGQTRIKANNTCPRSLPLCWSVMCLHETRKKFQQDRLKGASRALNPHP